MQSVREKNPVRQQMSMSERKTHESMTDTAGIIRVRIYDSVEWQRSRENVLELDQYIDVYMYMTEGVMIRADTVHHIIPLRDDWNKE